MADKEDAGALRAEILDELLEGQHPVTVLRYDGLLGDLKKALAEWMRNLTPEADVYLDSEAERKTGNHRNRSSPKTVFGENGEVVLSIPRDRHGAAVLRKLRVSRLNNPLRWRSGHFHKTARGRNLLNKNELSAFEYLPTNQGVGGSNPSGRAK